MTTWEERRRLSKAAVAAAAGHPQRKLVELNITETSGVGHPAHGHEGWLVQKSAATPPVAGHAHDDNYHYLNGAEQKSAALLHGTDSIKPGDRKPVEGAEERAAIGRDTCGCLYLLSPETVQKGTETRMAKAAASLPRPQSWTDGLNPAELAYLKGETNELPK